MDPRTNAALQRGFLAQEPTTVETDDGLVVSVSFVAPSSVRRVLVTREGQVLADAFDPSDSIPEGYPTDVPFLAGMGAVFTADRAIWTCQTRKEADGAAESVLRSLASSGWTELDGEQVVLERGGRRQQLMVLPAGSAVIVALVRLS